MARRPPPAPDREAALAQYRGRAPRYDLELLAFEPLRREAVAALGLRAGDTVLDIACGTGLSLPLLRAAVGGTGRVVGVEQSPEMIELARRRVAAAGWDNVTLVEAPAQQAALPRQADAALFVFTHDVLRSPAAVAHVLAHLRPGAHIAATGLCWAPPLAWPLNAFVWAAALYSTTSQEGLQAPWSLLADAAASCSVASRMMGATYLARATR